MRIVDTRIEPADEGRFCIVTTIEIDGPEVDENTEPIGAGPTGSAVPDQIVKALISSASGSMSLSEIHLAVGGNPGTVNRQAWTLATNAPDLQKRLRGW